MNSCSGFLLDVKVLLLLTITSSDVSSLSPITITYISDTLRCSEDADYDKVIARYKSEGLGDNWGEHMRIVPVNFNKEHKAMLGHCKRILEHEPKDCYQS